MGQIDLFDVKALFPGVRSMALVGNAPSALAQAQGVRIDNYDLVVRFNRATTRGFETQIGSRTDILICNELNHLGRSDPPAQTLKPKCVLCFVHPWTIANRDSRALRDWVGDIPFCLTFAPDVVRLPTTDRIRQLTMGNYALYALPQMFPITDLMLTGFTLFGAVPGGASTYFSRKQEDFELSVWHDLDIEARVMAAMLERFDGDLFVTDEVQALITQFSSKKPRHLVNSRAVKPLLSRLGWLALRLGVYLRRITE